jgi:hypothetical protein
VPAGGANLINLIVLRYYLHETTFLHHGIMNPTFSRQHDQARGGQHGGQANMTQIHANLTVSNARTRRHRPS